MDATNVIIPELSIDTIKSLMTSEERLPPYLSAVLNWPSKLRIYGGKIVKWDKKDDDLVREGEQIVIITFTLESTVARYPIEIEIIMAPENWTGG